MKLPLILLFGSSLLLNAQTRPAPLILGGEYQFSADLDDGGDFSRSTLRLQGGIPLVLNDKTIVALNAEYQFDNYDFNDTLVAPWSEVHRTRIGILANTKLQNGWTILGAPFIAAEFENGADFGDALTFGGVGAGWYQVNDSLALGFGGGVISVLEDDLAIFPLAVIIWNLREDLVFSTLPPEGFRFRPGANLRWDVDEQLSLALVYQYEFDQQRLDEDSEASPDGLGELTQHRLSLAATYRFSDNFVFTGHAGFTLAGQIELQNPTGDEISEEDFDSSLVIGFEGAWRF